MPFGAEKRLQELKQLRFYLARPPGTRKRKETIMKTTNTIQHALFRTIDSLDRQTLRDGHAVRELLIQTALQLTPFLHAAVAQHIEMLVTEYCAT
jgi:hypothetical protein